MTVTVSEGLSLNSNYIKMGRNARRGLSLDLRGTIFTFIVVSILFTVSLTFKTPPQVRKGICDSRRGNSSQFTCTVHSFFHSVCRNAGPSLYFEPKPNLSKTIEGLPMRLIIIVNTILQLTSLTEYYSMRSLRVRVKGEQKGKEPSVFVCLFVLFYLAK